MTFDLIAAVDRERGIGKDGDLPWRLPRDLRFFESLTRGDGRDEKPNAVIMGKKTWFSIPEKMRPLKKRKNIVVSRRGGFEVPEGVVLCGDFASAVEAARGCARCFIVGGAAIYEAALADPRCGMLYLTAVDGSFGCDTFFPVIPDRFQRVDAGEPITENGITYRFEQWKPSKS